MIRPRQFPVERQVLLDHACAKGRRRNGDADPLRVIGIAHRQAECASQRLHREQIDLVEGRRIFGRAMEQRDALPQDRLPFRRLEGDAKRARIVRGRQAHRARRQHPERCLDFAQVAHPGRQDELPARGPDLRSEMGHW